MPNVTTYGPVPFVTVPYGMMPDMPAGVGSEIVPPPAVNVAIDALAVAEGAADGVGVGVGVAVGVGDGVGVGVGAGVGEAVGVGDAEAELNVT